MDHKKLTLRVGGGAIVVMGMVFLLGILPLYFIPRDILAKGFSLGHLFGLIFGVYFITMAFRYFAYNRIEITSRELRADVQELGRAVFQIGGKAPVLPDSSREMRRMIFPRYNRVRIELSDINHVMIGELKLFDKLAAELNSPALNETLDFWHQWFINAKMIMPLWLAAQYTPVMFVQSKSGNSFIIPTKPYSKNGFIKLVKVLKVLNVPLSVQPSLGLT